MVKACDGFDPARGVCFSTYAVPVILGEIKKLFRDGGAVKVSRSVKELGLKVNAERERRLKQNGMEPTVGQLAQTLGVTPEQVAVAIHAAIPVVSLTPADEEDGRREWDIPVDSPEERLRNGSVCERYWTGCPRKIGRSSDCVSLEGEPKVRRRAFCIQHRYRSLAVNAKYCSGCGWNFWVRGELRKKLEKISLTMLIQIWYTIYTSKVRRKPQQLKRNLSFFKKVLTKALRLW